MASETIISDLTLATTINDSDDMLIEDAISTKRIKPEKIAEYVTSKLSAQLSSITEIDTRVTNIENCLPNDISATNKLVSSNSLSEKQDKLSAGEGINIENNTISCLSTGGGFQYVGDYDLGTDEGATQFSQDIFNLINSVGIPNIRVFGDINGFSEFSLENYDSDPKDTTHEYIYLNGSEGNHAINSRVFYTLTVNKNTTQALKYQYVHMTVSTQSGSPTVTSWNWDEHYYTAGHFYLYAVQ